MIAQFALRLLCGISLMWCVMPRAQVTSGFFRIQSLVALGLGILAALSVGTWNQGISLPVAPATICIGMAVLAYFGSVFWRIEWRPYGTVVAFGIAAPVRRMFAADLWSYSRPVPLRCELRRNSFRPDNWARPSPRCCWGTGILTAPTMSIEPLSQLNKVFCGIGVVRLIVSSIGLAIAGAAIQSQTHWVWLALRWSAGIVGPLLMCWMVSRILKYKNTQSATGVLFAGVILVFIGEMTAALLDRELLASF